MALYGSIELPGRPDLNNIRKLDLLPIPMFRRMHRLGIAIDRDYFRELSLKLGAQLRSLKQDICSYIPEAKLAEFIQRSKLPKDDYLPMNVNSRDQLSTLLFDTLGIGSDRQLKTTKSGHRISTSKKQLEAIKRLHPVIPITLLYAEIHKLNSTYCKSLPDLAKRHPRGYCWCGLCHQGETWRIHTTFLGTRTDTGRISSKAPNLQQIPSRTVLGREIRMGFISSPGTRLVSNDYSQEEMRLGAHYSNDRNLIRIFELGIDPHNETAKLIFNTETPDYLTQRTPARNCNFGIFYGLSGPGLYDLMAITYATANLPMPESLTIEWCDDLIQLWFKAYPGVLEYLEKQYYRARRYGLVWTLFGRTRLVPEIHSAHNYIHSAGLRQAGNSPVQGSGADIIKLSMGAVEEKLIELQREGIWCWPLLTVHDDLIVEVEEDYTELVRDVMSSTMSEIMRDIDSQEYMLRMPLAVDGKIMARWQK